MFIRVEFYCEIDRLLNGHCWLDKVKILEEASDIPPSRGLHDVLVQLTAADPSFPRDQAQMERYDPIKRESALFRIFANTPATKEAILEFANQYGLLYSVGAKVELERDGRKLDSWGTPYTDWRNNILALRHWIKVWDFIADRDSRGLAQYERRLPELAQIEDEISGGGLTVQSLIGDLRDTRGLDRKQRLAAAKQALSFAVLESPLVASMRFNLKNDAAPGSLHPRLRAEHLVTALWMQFALAIVENKEYRRCKHCQKPYELAPDVARTNRDYCSHTCRLKAYRKRQKDAMRLHKKGKTLRAIADELESDVKFVRGWIAAAKEKQNRGQGKN
jgi:hypothetical protein